MKEDTASSQTEFLTSSSALHIYIRRKRDRQLLAGYLHLLTLTLNHTHILKINVIIFTGALCII
jgi:hypothetical protein